MFFPYIRSGSTDFKADKTADHDIFSDSSDGVIQVILNSLGIVLDEFLIQKANIFKPLRELPLQDFLLNRLWLVFNFG